MCAHLFSNGYNFNYRNLKLLVVNICEYLAITVAAARFTQFYFGGIIKKQNQPEHGPMQTR